MDDYTQDNYDVKVEVSPNRNDKIHTFLGYSEATRMQLRQKLHAEAAAKAKAKAKAKGQAQINALNSKRSGDAICNAMANIVKAVVRERKKIKTLETVQAKLVKTMEEQKLTSEAIAKTQSWVSSIALAAYGTPHLSAKREGELFLSKCKNDNENWEKYKENVSWLDWL